MFIHTNYFYVPQAVRITGLLLQRILHFQNTVHVSTHTQPYRAWTVNQKQPLMLTNHKTKSQEANIQHFLFIVVQTMLKIEFEEVAVLINSSISVNKWCQYPNDLNRQLTRQFLHPKCDFSITVQLLNRVFLVIIFLDGQTR